MAQLWGLIIILLMRKCQRPELCENSIKLYDFEGDFYEIDFSGKLPSLTV